MTSSSRIKRQRLVRRRFLRSVSGGLLSVGALSCSDEWVRADEDPHPPPAREDYEPLLAAYFGDSDLEAARLIGSYYATSAGWNVEAAFASTAKVRHLVDDLASASEAAQVEALDMRLQQDFETLRIVDVDGWTLGQTEIDLCVLAALA